MNKKSVGIIFVLMLAISMIPMQEVEANQNSISILPPSITISGESGDFVTRAITIINNENDTVHVFIDTPKEVYIYPEEVILDAYESADITLWMIISDYSLSSFIYYNCTIGSDIKPPIVQYISIEPEFAVTMELFPSKPKPGGSLLVLLSPALNAQGFIFFSESGKVDFFNVTEGFKIISLDTDDIGEAMIYVRGNFPPIIKMINIGNISDGGGSLSFNIPSDVEIGDTDTIVLRRDGSPEPYHTVTITRPDDSSFTKSTDSNGCIILVFNQEGKWRFEVDGTSATLNVQGEHAPPEITISAPSSADIGDTIYITLLRAGEYVSNEKVIIQKPESPLTYQYTNELGQVVLTVDRVGHWTVAAGGKSHAIDVSKKEMVIGVPSDAEAGHSATVEVDDGSHVKIVGVDYSKEWSASSGTVTFTPPTSGIYEVTAETDTSKGIRAFQVFETPTIALFNPQGIQVTTGFSGSVEANPGQYYYIKVLSDGEVVGSIGSVEVTGPPSQVFPTGVQTVNIGSLWQPLEGVYTIISPETGLYKEATLMVESTVPSGGGDVWPIVTSLVVAGVAVGVIIYKKKTIKGWWEKRKGKPREKKDEDLE